MVISNWYSLYRYVSKPDERAAAQPPSQKRPDFNDSKSCQVGCKGASSWNESVSRLKQFQQCAAYETRQLDVRCLTSSLTWTNKSASASTSLSWDWYWHPLASTSLSWALLEADWPLYTHSHYKSCFHPSSQFKKKKKKLFIIHAAGVRGTLSARYRRQPKQSDWSFRISAPKPTADITVATVSGANASLSLK